MALTGSALAVEGVEDVASPVTTVNQEEIRKMGPVLVTGSLIPTVELITPTALDSYTDEAIKKSGAATVQQLLKLIPSTYGVANFGDSQGNGGDGTAAVGLRGIDGGTLVLINGRRLAPNQFLGRGNVDINAIPVAAIDHIEVLKDGASAIYGADAVAGVINVILKKDFNGVEMDGRYGNTTDTDVSEYSFSFVTGVSNEKSGALVGASYYKSNTLFSYDRERSTPDLADPLQYQLNTSSTGNPGRIGNGQLGTGGIGLIYTGAAGTNPTSTSDFRDFDSTTDRFNFNVFTPAIRPSERWYIFGNAHHQIFDDKLEFFTELSYAHTISFNQLAPTPIVGEAVIPIPATNPFNLFGVDIDAWRYRLLEAGPRTEDNFGDIYRFVGGFRGKVPDRPWEWELAVMYSQDDRLQIQGGDVNQSNLEDALQDTDPATAFNPFGNTGNNATVTDFVTQTLFQRATSRIAQWDARINGDLFEIPAGTVKLAFGGGMFNEVGEYRPDQATKDGNTVGFNQSLPFRGERDVGSVFAEVAIPVFSEEKNIPLFHAFEIRAAGRFDDYSDFGDTENPRVSFKWQPVDETITLRGSYGTSFQAPNFDRLYLTAQGFPEILVPVMAPDGTVYTNGGAFDQPSDGGLFLSDPNLKPQTSDNYTIGVVWEPKMEVLKGLTVSVDYYRIEIHDFFAQSTQFVADNFSPSDINPLTGNPYITVSSAGDLIGLEVPQLNLDLTRTDGLDISAIYEFETDNFGKFTIAGNWNYILTFEQRTAPGNPIIDRLGDFSIDELGFQSVPRLKGDVGMTWEYEDFTFGVTGHYTHSYRDDALAAPADEVVSAIWTVDLQMSYRFPTETTVTFGIINIADEPPPQVFAAFADQYDRDFHDLRQRFWYVAVNQKW
jgi:outer membrane receptor protein involved in Fe transport